MELTVPGDKSISQRALILAALASGESHLRGLLTSDDPVAAADVLRALGVAISDLNDPAGVTVRGRGLRGLDLADRVLDCGNSGTCARLMLGVLAGQSGTATLTGDESLQVRPMARVTDPLGRMGARIAPLNESGRLPLRVEGTDLGPTEHRSTVASAQVKSALLLAGLVSGSDVSVIEPSPSRDHTERMLAALGIPIKAGPDDTAWRIDLVNPPAQIDPLDLEVPGDFSSAAFFVVLALLGGAGTELTIRGCGLNPTRTGLLRVLDRMGADIEVTVTDGATGDPRGDLTVRPSRLTATTVEGDEVPSFIDEIPILAVAAARAEGVTRIVGARELRVKETDRIEALVQNFRQIGAQVEEFDDGLEIVGSDAPLAGRVKAYGDHRIGMAFGVLDALPHHSIDVDDRRISDVSFPGFWALLEHADGR